MNVSLTGDILIIQFM